MAKEIYSIYIRPCSRDYFELRSTSDLDSMGKFNKLAAALAKILKMPKIGGTFLDPDG
jgi:hypothetical protein